MKQILFLASCLIIHIGCYAQQDPVSELLGPDCMEAGSASIIVYDLDKEKEIYSFDPERALPTASIMKLLTTAAALHQRGADYRYHTTVGYTGSIVNGVLDGDIVLVGSGDPTLGSGYFDDNWDIDQLADSLSSVLRELGIERVTGGLKMDTHISLGQHVPGGWPWSDLGNYYGAGHFAINVNDNEYKIYFKQNNTPGRKTEILRTIPEQLPFEFQNEVRTGPHGSGDQAYVYAAPYSVQAAIRGTIPPGQGSFSIRGSLTDPPLFLGMKLNEALMKSGIVLGVKPESSAHQQRAITPLFVIPSPSLLDIIRITNYHSVNLYAEGLLKLLCDDSGHIDSQFECGLKTLREIWEDQGVDDDQYFFRDGSGLSPRNTASAQTFVSALKAIYKEKSWFDPFVTTMAVMGEEGTLRYMLRGYNGSGRIHAKSGYIGRQRSYAGYMVTESGRNLAFCVMLDNYGCSSTRMRQRIERFLIGFLKE